MIEQLTETHPGILEKALAMLESGMTQTAIAKHFDISRDRLRTLFRKNQINVDDYKIAKITDDTVRQAIQLYLSGKTWEEVEKTLGHRQDTIKSIAGKLGYDISALIKTKRLHSWDGREFGSWKVVPGTTGLKGTGTVMTECVCGKRVVSLKSNLLSHASRSCGCVGLKKDTRGDQSKHMKWTCLETGEVVATTCALAKLLNVKNPTLYRQAARLLDYEDPLGYTWRPSPYLHQASEDNRSLLPELNYIRELIETGKTIPEIARILKVDYQRFYKFAKKQDLIFNPTNAVSNDEVIKIRRMHEEGITGANIGRQLGVSAQVVSRIINGRTYTNV